MSNYLYLIRISNKHTSFWTENIIPNNILLQESIDINNLLINFTKKIPKETNVILSIENNPKLEKILTQNIQTKTITVPYLSDLETILNIFNTYQDIDNIIYFESIDPLFDVSVLEELLNTHTKYKADFSFSENLPKGIVPSIFNRSIIEALSIHEPNFLKNPTTINLPFTYYIEKNINKYHVEIHYGEPDLRMLRLDFTGKNIRSIIRLNRFTKKIKNINNPFTEINNIILEEPSILHVFPSYLEIELISDCDYACTFCPRQHTKQIKYTMSNTHLHQIESFLKTSLNDSAVCFGGMGEPLLHPNILEYAQKILDIESLTYLIIETNGYNLEKIFSLSQHTNFHKLKIILNINSFTQYAKIHGVPQSYLDKVLNNLDLWIQNIPQDKHKDLLQNIHLQILKMNENENEIDEIYNFTQKKSIQFLLQKYNTYNNIMPQKRVSDMTPLKRSFCWHLRRDLFIRANGDISFCKQDINNEQIRGNINNISIDTIWNNIKQDWNNNYLEKYQNYS